MKYKILDIYNARLDERIKRKKFVIERGLLDFNKQNNLDKSRTKEEKEIYNLMKVFARFNTGDDHEKLVQGIIKEKQIRQRIEELKFYRKLGIKTFEEVEVNFKIYFNIFLLNDFLYYYNSSNLKNFLLEKRKKDEAYQKKQKQIDNYIYENKVKRSNLICSLIKIF